MSAEDLRYCLYVERVVASGTVWSSVPVTSSSGPRRGLRVSTRACARGARFASAAWKTGRAGAGIAQRS